MFGIPAAERAAVEATYEDTADILRVEVETGENGISSRVLRTLHSGIRCALSYTGSDSSGQTMAQNEIQWDAVLFAPPELDIQPGDRVELHRLSGERVYTFSVAGRPKIYATHQEVRLKEEEIA